MADKFGSLFYFYLFLLCLVFLQTFLVLLVKFSITGCIFNAHLLLASEKFGALYFFGSFWWAPPVPGGGVFGGVCAWVGPVGLAALGGL